LGNIVLPESIKQGRGIRSSGLGDGAFKNNKLGGGIIIPKGVTEVEGAFDAGVKLIYL
jgi:hypothetical protein